MFCYAQVTFTNMRPQGCNRPSRVHKLILDGLEKDAETRMCLSTIEEQLNTTLKDLSTGLYGKFLNVTFHLNSTSHLSQCIALYAVTEGWLLLDIG